MMSQPRAGHQSPLGMEGELAWPDAILQGGRAGDGSCSPSPPNFLGLTWTKTPGVQVTSGRGTRQSSEYLVCPFATQDRELGGVHVGLSGWEMGLVPTQVWTRKDPPRKAQGPLGRREEALQRAVERGCAVLMLQPCRILRRRPRIGRAR
ncbi:hypothetical protein J1605_006946 [Eschrichtius robustus]|uniref:Uncharacterized protein n=1 Tax=Eschrichtius robustus TaxID=9764 RepID=A0AB34H2V9_ESCRO|nr:hypothetical protein J1605_006946 [Eschrichtius robustus]